MRLTTRSCTLLFTLLMCVCQATAGGPPDPTRVKDLASMLPKSPRGVGRPIGDREAWEAVANSCSAKDVIRRAEALLAEPIPELTDELYLEFSRNGNRTRCQRVISARHGRVSQLVLAECLENRGRFLPAIEEAIRAVCAEKSWLLPAHDRSLTNFKGTEITIDLVSSATGWELATADYWLGDKLGPDVRKLVDDELERRIFVPYEGMITRGKPALWWLATTNNWNAVCLSNVTGAALAQIESTDRRAWFVASAEKYIQNFLKGFTPDGYCSEGLGYWNYGFGHYVMLSESLHQATGGQVDLMATPLVREIAQYGRRMEITPGVYPAFADCSPGARPTGWITGYVNRRFDFGWPQRSGPLLTLDEAGDLFTFGLFAFPNSVSERPVGKTVAPEQPLRTWFADAGILIGRPDPGAKRPFGIAMKGGHNAEHHNHNDVGSFIVALGDKTPLVDPGSETYTRRTFSNERYVSGVLNSWGHAVPRIGGELQQTGRQAAARVLKTEFDDKADTLVLDLSAAYKVKSLKRLVRTFVYSREAAGSLRVKDEAEFDSPTAFETALITFDKWQRVDAEHLRIGQGDGAVDVEIDTAGASMQIRPDEIQEDLHGHALPTRLGIELTDPTQKATITTIIRPAK